MPGKADHAKFGSHVSIRGGYLAAARTARSLGAAAFQYFPKNPRSLTVKSYDRNDAEACARYCAEEGLLSIAHTSYATNIATSDESLRAATVRSLFNDLEIADACGSIGVVVHFGKYKGEDPLQGYKNVLQCLDDVLSKRRANGAMVLIENQAGEGCVFGTTFEELVQIRRLSRYSEHIGFCFDTCHAFACGMWNGSDGVEVVRRGEQLDFFAHVQAIHFNDSVYPSGSFRDRHANVGRGQIGEAGMFSFLREACQKDLPVILETPHTSVYSHTQEIAYLHETLIKYR